MFYQIVWTLKGRSEKSNCLLNDEYGGRYCSARIPALDALSVKLKIEGVPTIEELVTIDKRLIERTILTP